MLFCQGRGNDTVSNGRGRRQRTGKVAPSLMTTFVKYESFLSVENPVVETDHPTPRKRVRYAEDSLE